MDEYMSTLSESDKHAVDCLMRLKPGHSELASGNSGVLVDMETDECRLKGAQNVADLILLCPVAQPPTNLAQKTLDHVRSRAVPQKSGAEKKNSDQPS
jgi:hypothetical protein